MSFITLRKKLWRKKEEPPNVNSKDQCIPAQHSTINVQDSSTHIKVTGSGNSIAMGVSTRGADPLSLLLQYATKGAELDSNDRYPPPRCHPNTRTRLQNEIHTWADNSQREKAMLWLYGPAGVGKSAVFQTFAEKYRKANPETVVAAFFLSRPNKRNDPESIFITLAYQLCTQCEEYKFIIGDVLAKDPLLPTRHFDVQFCKLIVEPLSMLRMSRKILILIDGLDECKGADAQCEIVELIIEVASSNPNLPVVWMFSSRPEPHLQMLLNRSDVRQACWREELPVDTDEAKEDNSTYIREEFACIRKTYSSMLDPDWPGEDRLCQLIDASSGLFAFSSTIIRFVGDRSRPFPESNLRKVMGILKPSTGTSVTTSGNEYFLQLLDTLYMRILSETDEENLPTTLKILHYLCLGSETNRFNRLSIQGLVNYLSLDKYSFWTALGKLHSVLQIPFPPQQQNALYEEVKFLHASFQDFLQNPNRSGPFCVPKAKMTSYIITRASELITSDLYWAHMSKFQIQPDERYQKAITLLSWSAGSLAKWPAAFWVENKLLIDEIVLRVINDLKLFLGEKEALQFIGEAQEEIPTQLPPTLENTVSIDDEPYYDFTYQDPEVLSWYLALPKAQTLDKDTLSPLHKDQASDSYIGSINNADGVRQQVVVQVVKAQPSEIPTLMKKTPLIKMTASFPPLLGNQSCALFINTLSPIQIQTDYH